MESVAAFDMAMKTSAGVVILHVATGAGVRFISWTYDKVKNMLKPNLDGEQQSDASNSEISPLRTGLLDGQSEQVAGDLAEVQDDMVDDDIAEGFARAQLERRPLILEQKD